MRYLPLVCLLLGTLAWGQEEPLQSNVPPEDRPPITHDGDDQQALPVSASRVAPDAAVITIKGLCPRAALSSASASDRPCQTVITRAQFENLSDAILKNMKPSMKRQVASAYPNLLAMAREGEARGLEKTPRFKERLAFARLQILSQELIRQIDEESANIPEKDIEDYYHTHAALFEQAIMERIFIPNRKRNNPLAMEKVAPENLKAQQKEAEDAMTRVAEELRTRAAAGGDFLQLQKEAYAAAGATDVPPNPSLGQLRSANLPPRHTSVFALKPSEVSQVLSDSTGHYVYKLDAKKIEPLEEVRDEIHKTLQNQHREEAIQAVQRPITSEFNQAYFGPTEKDSGPEGPKSK